MKLPASKRGTGGSGRGRARRPETAFLSGSQVRRRGCSGPTLGAAMTQRRIHLRDVAQGWVLPGLISRAGAAALQRGHGRPAPGPGPFPPKANEFSSFQRRRGRPSWRPPEGHCIPGSRRPRGRLPGMETGPPGCRSEWLLDAAMTAAGAPPTQPSVVCERESQGFPGADTGPVLPSLAGRRNPRGARLPAQQIQVQGGSARRISDGQPGLGSRAKCVTRPERPWPVPGL